jgi:hypothetical protein
VSFKGWLGGLKGHKQGPPDQKVNKVMELMSSTLVGQIVERLSYMEAIFISAGSHGFYIRMPQLLDGTR